MSALAQDAVPIIEAGSRLSELAQEVVAGGEMVLTKDGAPYVALIDARKLDYYHSLEADYGSRVMLHDAEKGLEDALAGKVQSEEDFSRSLRGLGFRDRSG